MMKGIIYKPIGIIHTPFKDVKEMPIQPIGAKGIQGTIEIEPDPSCLLRRKPRCCIKFGAWIYPVRNIAPMLCNGVRF